MNFVSKFVRALASLAVWSENDVLFSVLKYYCIGITGFDNACFAYPPHPPPLRPTKVCWVQEEPKNMGAWSFVAPCIETSSLKLNEEEKRPRYIGRPTAASPATGLYKAS